MPISAEAWRPQSVQRYPAISVGPPDRHSPFESRPLLSLLPRLITSTDRKRIGDTPRSSIDIGHSISATVRSEDANIFGDPR